MPQTFKQMLTVMLATEMLVAYMGDVGSINGSIEISHFEIWGKGQKLDPEKMAEKKINNSGIRICCPNI